MRIAVVLPDRLRKTNLRKNIQRGRPRLLAVDAAMNADTFGDLVADAHQRVEMAGRILEDHADVATAHSADLGFRCLGKIAAVERHRARGDRQLGRRHQPHQRPTGQALARAAFADEAKDLALAEVEGHGVDQRARTILAGEDDAEVADGEQRLAHSRTPRRSPRPSPVREKPKASVTMESPGNSVIHQAVVMKLCPSATITPHSAIGGCTPRPR